MTIVYFDSSAFVKLLVDEAGSDEAAMFEYLGLRVHLCGDVALP